MNSKKLVIGLLLEWILQNQAVHLSYVFHTAEILSFLHNKNIVSNGKRSFKCQISVRLEQGSFAS